MRVVPGRRGGPPLFLGGLFDFFAAATYPKAGPRAGTPHRLSVEDDALRVYFLQNWYCPKRPMAEEDAL